MSNTPNWTAKHTEETYHIQHQRPANLQLSYETSRVPINKDTPMTTNFHQPLMLINSHCMKYHLLDLVQQPRLDSRDRQTMEMLLDIYLTRVRHNPSSYEYNTSPKCESCQSNCHCNIINDHYYMNNQPLRLQFSIIAFL